MSTITAFARVAERVAEEEGVARLIELFNQGVGQRHGTRLVRGGEEPVYLPADARCRHHRIVFAHGYFASALHELAHWCIAGAARRQQVRSEERRVGKECRYRGARGLEKKKEGRGERARGKGRRGWGVESRRG